MISALLFLQYHSIKNRLVGQIKRFRQPKYLVLSVVGGLYTYFFFFRHIFRRPADQTWSISSPEHLALFESIAALIFFVLVLLAWVIPRERAALAFTEAEVAFLFPAPISRRGLIHFKLLRSQAGILFTTLFLTLLFNRFGGNLWIRALGWWIMLSALNLHTLGSSFARTMLLDRGITNWQRRIAILTAVAAVAVAAVLWAQRTLPAADPAMLNDMSRVQEYVKQLFSSGPLPFLLYPFRLIVRPFLAPNLSSFLFAAGPALLILLAHYAWVARSDVAFEEASVEASRKMAERVAAVRAGNWNSTGKKAKAKRPPFNLSPLGPPAVALLWKNLIQAGQAFSARIWILLAVGSISAAAIFQGTGKDSGVAQVIGFVAMMFLIWSVLLGPQVARQDLRQDLMHVDLLKMFPLRGWQIVLGELLAPAVILTGIQWFLLIVSIGFFQKLPAKVSFSLLISCGLSAAMVFPMINLISLLISNAAVLMFPAWFQIGKTGAQGIEATGQRLVSMLAQLIIYILALVPAAIVFAIVFALGNIALNLIVAIPLATLGAVLVLALEVGLGVMLLGRLFERFDLSAEMPG